MPLSNLKSVFAPIAAAVLLLSTAACTTWDLQELKKAEPKGTPFQVELAKHYLAFSEVEAKRHDWVDSQYFARKGLIAAYGKDVEPEDPENWEIPETILPSVVDARKQLTQVLQSGAPANNPQVAASALFHYDCWVENQEEAWQTKEIDYCKGKFMEAMDALMKKPDQQEPQMPADVSYTIFFNSNSVAVSPQGLQILSAVANEIAAMNADEVIINGHTDRAGSASRNLELGMKRAENVRGELVKKGVRDETISVFSFGETDPKLATEDGVAEAKNRRVEIFLVE